MKNYKIYAEVLEHEALNQFYEALKLPCVVQGALMPDAHTGYALPIGAVVKTKNKVFPSWVGYDIGCGMSSIQTDITEVSVDDLKTIRDRILQQIPLGVSKHLKKQEVPKLAFGTEYGQKIYQDLAGYQVGTLGGGNHFIELGVDRSNKLNIVIHSGSRGIGKKIAEHHMKLAAIKDVDEDRYIQEFRDKNSWESHNPEAYKRAMDEFVYRRTRARVDVEGNWGFDIHTEEGKAYLQDLNSALTFALVNRETMIQAIIKILSDVLEAPVNTSRFINRNHNHAEVVDGFVIHRKGATHAEDGMLGVIPGNMRDGCFIVRGKGNTDSLCSSSHGAGRVLSRRVAKDTLNYEDMLKATEGVINNHTEATIDESPEAYKNIFEVMELQKDLVDVVDYIQPILNIKG